MTSAIKTARQLDPPVDLSGSYQIGSVADRRGIDDQILALAQHVVYSLARGQISSWYPIDGSSPPLGSGSVVCAMPVVATEDDPNTALRPVTLAVPSVLGGAGAALGVVVEVASGFARVAMAGIIGPSITGLAAGAAGIVRVSSTGRCERVASLSPGDVQIGTVGPVGNMTLTPGGASSGGGGGGGLDPIGTPSQGDLVAWDVADADAVWTSRSALAVNSFAAASPLVQAGASVVNPAFTASYSVSPTTALLTNNSDSESKDVHSTPMSFASSHTFNFSGFGSAVTFTVTVGAPGQVNATRNATITAGQKNYSGVGAAGQSGAAFILSLTASALATSRAGTFSYNATGSNAVYFATRTGYGTPTFKDPDTGLAFDVFKVGDYSVTNSDGFAENYQLWQSTNVGLGSGSFQVT